MQTILLLGPTIFAASCGVLKPGETMVRSSQDPPIDCLIEQMKFTEGYIPSPLCNR
jgi:hypothetical protein